MLRSRDVKNVGGEDDKARIISHTEVDASLLDPPREKLRPRLWCLGTCEFVTQPTPEPGILHRAPDRPFWTWLVSSSDQKAYP